MKRRVLQIEEWGRVRADLSAREKNALQAKAQAWQQQNQLSAPPLWFEGTQGQWLRTRSYVGILETDFLTLEIWPKMETNDQAPHSVMKNFLWLLEVAESEVDVAYEAQLHAAPLEFFDVISLLFSRRLLHKLQDGLPLEYQSRADDLPLVRGRIQFARQATRNWDRRDQTACAWDEMSVDTPLARLLKCACRLLSQRVRNRRAVVLLNDCLAHLGEATDVTPRVALSEVIAYNRHSESLRNSALFARRLLESAAYEMVAGSAPGFTFLVNMNTVFEHYVRAVLQAHFGVAIAAQHQVGTLLWEPQQAIAQRADFRWQTKENLWLGDAKYKVPYTLPDANDVRQVTVYGEIEQRKRGALPHLALLYPFVEGEFQIKATRAWNNAALFFVPVRLSPPNRRLREAFPDGL
jgi:5-methylcytosine-specific restriction enzyme subunit McrC